MPTLLFTVRQPISQGFPGGPDGKESACNAGNPGLMPGLQRSLGEGNGNALLYSCLEYFMGRGAWWATVHGFTKSQTWLSKWQFHFHSSQPLSTPSTPSSQLQAWACDPSLFNQVQATNSGKHKSHSVHYDPFLSPVFPNHITLLHIILNSPIIIWLNLSHPCLLGVVRERNSVDQTQKSARPISPLNN